MKNKKRIKESAEKIIALEKECQLGKNVQENMQKMQDIMLTLSFEDLLFIDEYIQSQLGKNLDK